MELVSRFSSDLHTAEARYGISSSTKNAIMIAPIIALFLAFLFLSIRVTRAPMLWMLTENHPIELFTFVALLGGGLCGLALALRLKRQAEAFWIVGFYMSFSFALILVGMEEVAWGQSFLKFQTPQLVESINAQKELTIHNIKGLQGHSEIFRLIFGLGGIIGVVASFIPGTRKIGAPAILLPCLLVIVTHAAVDVYDDLFPLGPIFNFLMQRTSELVEALIGAAGLLYVWLNARMFQTHSLSEPGENLRPKSSGA